MPTLRLTRTNTSRPVNIRLTTQPRPTHPLLIADLASTGAMDDPAFIAYLEYLRYWEQPQYAKFVHYPHAFYFLEQLRRPEFRKAMANPRLAEQAHAHQFKPHIFDDRGDDLSHAAINARFCDQVGHKTYRHKKTGHRARGSI